MGREISTNTPKRVWTKGMLLLLLSLLTSACTTPTSRLKLLAESHDFAGYTLNAKGFDHLVYTSNFPLEEDYAKSVLHVYFEGDGSPWLYRVVTAQDPTPRNPLALRLMAKDVMPSAYIGRPCYNGNATKSGCDSTMWTSGRYSPAVVRSMAQVIRDIVEQHGFKEIKLIGHSGGGTLAMLVAARIDAVSHVITVAGNLDTDAWTAHHGYLRLYTSINPAKQPDLPAHIKQWHLLGGRDGVIPPSTVKPFIVSQKNALGVLVEGYSHSCCWEADWGVIANAIKTSSPNLLPGRRFTFPEH